jgi:hypothetical protein
VSERQKRTRKMSAAAVRRLVEYGTPITPEDMLATIEQRSWSRVPDRPTPKRWYDENHAEPGPNGLARHRIGSRCIGHGSGTYDYMVGEFS